MHIVISAIIFLLFHNLLFAVQSVFVNLVYIIIEML